MTSSSSSSSTATAATTSTTSTRPVFGIFTGSSNTGMATIRALAKYRDRILIRAAVFTASKAAAVKAAGAEEVITGVDMTKPDTLKPFVAGLTKLFIAPAPTAERGDREKAVVQAAKAAGVKQLVIISVPGASTADAKSIQFARQFGSLHKDIVALGIPCTFLECGYFMQNLMGSAGAIKAGVLPVTTGKGKFCPVDIEDIGAVAAQVLVEDVSIHTGKIYTITGPESLNGDDMAAIFSKVLGKPIKVDMWDQKKTGEMYKSFGIPDWQLPGMLELMHVFEQGWASTPALDVNKIVWHHTTLEQFIIRNKSAFT